MIRTLLTYIRKHYFYNPASGTVWRKYTDCWTTVGSLTKHGYIRITIRVSGAHFPYAHQIGWFLTYGVWPDKQIDHINRKRSDNRLSNLRLATISQQRMNRGKGRLNKSGFKGVFYRPDTNNWCAQITAHGEVHHLGLFDTPHEAAQAYDDAAKNAHGEFACLNFSRSS